MKITLNPTILLAGLLATAPLALADHHAETATATKKKDIVDTAVAAGSFKTLAAALKAADLVGALKGKGPFTVFAPTDEAFAKLPKGTVESLLKPENKAQLVDILTYHVVSGNVPAKTAVTLKKAEALNKKTIKVKNKGDKGLFLNKSKVIKTDIECSNGVIHVIDAVLLPPAKDEAKKTSSTKMQPRHVVQQAIKKGTPLYNHGNHTGCTTVYVNAAKSLMKMPEGELSCSQRTVLASALERVGNSHCQSTNAWTMRVALEDSLRQH